MQKEVKKQNIRCSQKVAIRGDQVNKYCIEKQTIAIYS